MLWDFSTRTDHEIEDLLTIDKRENKCQIPEDGRVREKEHE